MATLSSLAVSILHVYEQKGSAVFSSAFSSHPLSYQSNLTNEEIHMAIATAFGDCRHSSKAQIIQQEDSAILPRQISCSNIHLISYYIHTNAHHWESLTNCDANKAANHNAASRKPLLPPHFLQCAVNLDQTLKIMSIVALATLIAWCKRWLLLWLHALLLWQS